MNENRPTDRAPAHLVLLPTAAPLPVVQPPRRGRYPRSVISLAQARENIRRRERFVEQLHDLDLRLAGCEGALAAMHYIFESLQDSGAIKGCRK